MGPFDEISRAVEVLNRFRDAPIGRIRLSVPTEAAELLVGPVLATFAGRYPDVELEISVSNRMIDVIDGGFDSGIRYGGTVPEDLIAQRLSADIRWIVVASPAYLERFGLPVHPDDLRSHRCVRIRVGDDRIYRWEFECGDQRLEVNVPGPLIVDQAQVGLAAVKGGVGLMYVPEPVVTQLVQDGVLRIVLEDWASVGPGFHLYCSSRRHVPAGLKLFVDVVRELRPLGLWCRALVRQAESMSSAHRLMRPKPPPERADKGYLTVRAWRASLTSSAAPVQSVVPLTKTGDRRMLNPLLRAFVVTSGLTGPVMAQERVLISSNWGKVTAELADNDATRALVRMLPLTIEMRDHLRQEKTGNLPLPLPAVERQLDFSTGTLGLWSSDHFVIYYRDGRLPQPGIILLGQVTGDVSVFDQPGRITVRVERIGRNGP